MSMRVFALPGTSDGEPPEPWGTYEEAFLSAMTQIRPQRKQLTLAEATDIVLAECQRRGLQPRRRAVQGVARGALDPYWPFKHPIQAHREGYRWTWRG